MHDTTSPTTIGERIRAARQRAGLTQVALAIRTGLSLSSIRMAEYGLPPSARTIARIASALGMSIDQLRGRQATRTVIESD